VTRHYEMALRNEAKERTREAILDAAIQFFIDCYYDDVTLADIARSAGVSQQTVANHFGSKSDLYLTTISERWAPSIVNLRANAVVGDPASIVDAVCADYEKTGDATMRALAVAHRLDVIAEVMRQGRTFHRGWVESVFGDLLPPRGAERDTMITLLALALDVRTWAQLRREAGLSRRATRAHLLRLVTALVGD
jgi:AcrR family transcriptional regulator